MFRTLRYTTTDRKLPAIVSVLLMIPGLCAVSRLVYTAYETSLYAAHWLTVYLISA